ncbi:ISNCY family transposase [Phaeobacter gallaeciensis]|uniref:ISNCY family transposase n=1 Tax=Phaeobacter gallaeciensis TaxID=60890 RepID=UPI002380B1D9|nr:ISNCY family transposase [Phaeobacter gallaeciensis]MDE4276366.1 ISNCY family transposase [Phaeobacter gallaeciensis]MDE4301655.1 ISNCY family transposase [Phaeobacter gallaeciensis]MDE5186810.1 ISNCY family transposase [Phaeobacter gallaeciensis]
MGWVVMSERELNRIEIVSQVSQGRMSAVAAANVLGLSRRQVHRLLKRLETEGAASIRHKARGRPSNRRIDPGLREFAVSLVREQFADFGPTLAAEKLEELHGLKVSRETLRKWMVADGLWQSRKQRRTFHQPRLRRECFGELVQIDGSDHRWFEDRAPSCTLLVFIDDATSTLMQLRFVKSESTFSYFEALKGYLADHGRPVAFYSDKHAVFRVAQQGAKSGHGMTQFGRAMNELNIEILCANSSQAKGRVERANRTLQDRLVKELRLAGISDMEAGNAFLPGFIERYNAKFAKVPRRPDNLHRALNVEPDRLRGILCLRDERYVSQQLAFSYDRRRIILEENDVTRGLPGKYVDCYEFPDGQLEFRWKGVSLPYSVFDKDQRVTHAAITENKHLSAVLEFIKHEQDKAPPKKRRAGKQRTRYEPTGRRSPGRPSKLDAYYERKHAEQDAAAVASDKA